MCLEDFFDIFCFGWLFDGGFCFIVGLFDFNLLLEYIGKEIMKCLDFVKDGVYVLFLVLFVCNCFIDEEIVVVESL